MSGSLVTAQPERFAAEDLTIEEAVERTAALPEVAGLYPGHRITVSILLDVAPE